MTIAFNIFLRQSIREGSIPFAVIVNTPNATAIAAMFEAEQILSRFGSRFSCGTDLSKRTMSLR
jgi:DNA-damage-inducible protein J